MLRSKRYLTNNRYDAYLILVDKISSYRYDDCGLDDLVHTLFQSCELVDFKIDDNSQLKWKHYSEPSELERNDALHAELSKYPCLMAELRGYFKREYDSGPEAPSAFSQFSDLTMVWIDFLRKTPEDGGYFTQEYYSWIGGKVQC